MKKIALRAVLRVVIPSLIGWAEKLNATAMAKGVPLQEPYLLDAFVMGVKHPEKIRAYHVDVVPVPDEGLLGLLAKVIGIRAGTTNGMALGYAIFLNPTVANNRLVIAHESVHVAQYERLGGIRPFLWQYAFELLDDGYFNSPLEEEARSKSEHTA